MSPISGKDAVPERARGAVMVEQGWEWKSNARGLSGWPDFVFRAARVAVFVVGDFRYGWLFPQWKDKPAEKWEVKIEANHRRDSRNHQALRRAGGEVIRVWEHQIKADTDKAFPSVSIVESISPKI